MHDPKIGDIWKWTWESGNVTHVLITKDTGQKYYFGIDLKTGESELWEFGDEEIDKHWKFIA